MLMNIKCSAVTSINVTLTFDDNTVKNNLIALGDLIDVEYNHNGLRKRFQGKVICINATGLDPKGWTIMVDGSGEFISSQARFCPMNILDLVILKKASSNKLVKTTDDIYAIDSIRVKDGILEYSTNGINWKPIRIDNDNVIIKTENEFEEEYDSEMGEFDSDEILDDSY